MEFTHSKPGIFVVADDLGLAKPINDGVVFLLKEGKIGGASLMANGKAFEDAVNQVQTVSDPKIGIHLVLVEEKSLTGIKLPKDHRTFFIKYILGLIKLSDIEKELRAQVDKCLQAGIKPSFINSHQHLHLLPGIMDLVIKIAKEKNIKYIRLVNEPVHDRGKLFRKAQLKFLNLLSRMAKKKLDKAGISYNKVFIGFINAGNLTQEDIELARQMGGSTELGCHPGYETEELRQKYKHWGNYNWEKELNLLKNTIPIGVVKTS